MVCVSENVSDCEYVEVDVRDGVGGGVIVSVSERVFDDVFPTVGLDDAEWACVGEFDAVKLCETVDSAEIDAVLLPLDTIVPVDVRDNRTFLDAEALRVELIDDDKGTDSDAVRDGDFVIESVLEGVPLDVAEVVWICVREVVELISDVLEGVLLLDLLRVKLIV